MVGLAAGGSEIHGQSSVFSVRMAGSASHFGEAACPQVGLSIGGVGLAQQNGALFGLQASLCGQCSNVLGIGAPLTHGIGDADRRDLLHTVVIHGIPNRELSNGREAAAAPSVDAARSPR
jgi:hypothetical protein